MPSPLMAVRPERAEGAVMAVDSPRPDGHTTNGGRIALDGRERSGDRAPPRGPGRRGWRRPPFPPVSGASLSFALRNSGKRGATLALGSATGRALLTRLLA